MRRCALLAGLLCLVGSAAFAQDPVKVDPKHYKVEFENSQVRVLRITYGPHEKSVMHHHPDAVVTSVTDMHVKFNMPDGTSVEKNMKAGETMFTPAGNHLPENLEGKPMEGVLVELKHPAAAKPAAKPAAPKPGAK
jgi:quercetin dioxygenase-like cupin family protein